MAQDANSQLNKVMNRLRAQLYNTIEQMGFDDIQCNAYKQAVKVITSDVWNSVTDIVEKLEGKKE
ncbi:hypothetical protein KA005_64700 [bacterium]|nr:hypothetical protein [bacterium]